MTLEMLSDVSCNLIDPVPGLESVLESRTCRQDFFLLFFIQPSRLVEKLLVEHSAGKPILLGSCQIMDGNSRTVSYRLSYRVLVEIRLAGWREGSEGALAQRPLFNGCSGKSENDCLRESVP